MTIKLFPTQHDFVFETKHRESCLTGGYGSGKTFAAACKALYLATKNAGYEGAILSPTHGMLISTFIVAFEELLISEGFTYTYRASPTPFFILHLEEGDTKIHCRSGENYRRLASLNLAWAVVDEADLIDKTTLLAMWKMLQGRIRTGNVRHLAMSTTPEGLSGGAHQLFVKAQKPFRTIFKSKTTDNPYLPKDYIETLYASYTEAEIAAYINGEFTNLKSGTVYFAFNRKESHTSKTIESFHTESTRPVLHWGVDFNVEQTCGIASVLDNKGVVHVVAELTKLRDTEQLIERIQSSYNNYVNVIYPDSSGKSRQTATTITDITLLKNAFGSQNVKFHNKNPRILNRVKAVNAMFLNGNNERRLLVNTHACPVLTSCLEEQAWSESTGLPQKTHNVDHPLDALGYQIYYNFAIERRASLRNI